MASFKNYLENNITYLHACHSFGRLSHSVDTLIEHPACSRIHCICEWNGKEWTIRDLGLNGTWLNGKRLSNNTKVQLAEGDEISMGVDHQVHFKVLSLDKPVDMLISESANEQSLKVVPLKNYNIFPDAENGEVAIYRDCLTGGWLKEQISSISLDPVLLENGNQVYFSGQTWKFHHSHIGTDTVALDTTRNISSGISIEFETSLDEENTSVHVLYNDQKVSLSYRVHHYLSMSLGRKRIKDFSQGVPDEAAGWVYTDMLAGELGITPEHLNIQIHRIRKQVSQKINISGIEDLIIERRPNELRLGLSLIKIYKAGCLEASLDGQKTSDRVDDISIEEPSREAEVAILN